MYSSYFKVVELEKLGTSALTPKNASSSACSLHMGAVYLLVGSG